jgi:sulfatase modifying factor 1
VGIFNPYVVTTEAGQGPLLRDPTRRGDSASHRDAAAQRYASFIPSAALIVAALSSTAGCMAGAVARPVEPLGVHAHVRGDIPPIAAMAPPPSASQSTSQSTSPEARIVTVDTRSAVAAWRSQTADIDIEILANTSRCSVEMALVDGRVCVDRWEASLLERITNGIERVWSPYLPVDGIESRMRAVSRPDVIPQGYISGEQAARACAASGKRLCSSDEWENACRGSERTQFPYGNERKTHVCNDDIRSKHPVVEVAMLIGIPEGRLWYDGMNQPLINQLPDSLLETGARADCTNDYGVFDMVGNLHEWISDPTGTFRGGYYMDTTHNGDGCSYATTAHGFTYHDYSTGFRCCADPDRVE